jgi:ABC-type antimicrobial peptide transport system permease subunit
MVQMRVAEIGVRVAIGATRNGVLLLVLSEAMSLVSVGLLLGFPAGWAISRIIAASLPNMSPMIIGVRLLSSLILLFAGSLASFVPALRASRIDPVAALRGE